MFVEVEVVIIFTSRHRKRKRRTRDAGEKGIQSWFYLVFRNLYQSDIAIRKETKVKDPKYMILLDQANPLGW